MCCSSCGEKLTGGWRQGRSDRYAYYNCRNKKCDLVGLSIPKIDLEDRFISLLQNITPQDKFLKLFKTALMDIWESQHHVCKQEHKHYEKRLKNLEAQKERLTQMRISGELTKDEFMKHKDSLDNQIASVKISTNEVKINELDLETAISYCLQFLGSPARQWQDMKNVEHRARLQKVVFPQGLTYNKTDGVFYSAVLSPIFALNKEFEKDESRLVDHRGQR